MKTIYTNTMRSRIGGVALTPIERRVGKMLRAPDHDAGTAGATDVAGNLGLGVTGESKSNDAGQEFDGSTFWNESPSGSATPPSNGSSEVNESKGGADTDIGTTLGQQLQSMQFGEVMTEDVVKGINDGDYSKFNQALQPILQSAVKQSLMMNLQVMQKFGDHILSQVRAEQADTFTSRDNNDALVKAFPSAADPRVRPIVERIYGQAMKNTKGDRGAAIQQTKDMMALIPKTTGADLNLSVAPNGPESNGPQKGPTINWLEELMSQ